MRAILSLIALTLWGDSVLAGALPSNRVSDVRNT